MELVVGDGFEQFWERYPRRIGKLAALKAWCKLNPDEALVAQILDSIDEHRRCRNWRDGYIPNPATFINQGRYLDELGPDDFYRARL
jgi:hypothetical protein